MKNARQISRNAQISLVIFIAVLSVCSCKNASSSKNEPYRLYYFDNGGSCDPCAQLRVVGAKIAQMSKSNGKVPYLFQIVRTDRDELPALRKKCVASERELVIAWQKGDKVRAYRRFSLEEAVLNPDSVNFFMANIVDSLKMFSDSCAGSR